MVSREWATDGWMGISKRDRESRGTTFGELTIDAHLNETLQAALANIEDVGVEMHSHMHMLRMDMAETQVWNIRGARGWSNRHGSQPWNLVT